MHDAASEEVPSREWVERAWARESVLLPVMVEGFGGKHPAHILDIADGGAMIETDAVLRRGSTIVLGCGTVDASGVIVWDGAGRYGLKFSPVVRKADITNQP